MNYCSHCGQSIRLAIPEGDNRLRHICNHCGSIHYQNPRIIAGSLPYYGNRVLLCKRAIEPRYGLWTLPGGFMENGETTREAALRETLEEAQAKLSDPELYSLINMPDINQVYMIYRGELAHLDFGAGLESLEVRLFSQHEIPWDKIAFKPIRLTLDLFFQDLAAGHFPVHHRDINRC